MSTIKQKAHVNYVRARQCVFTVVINSTAMIVEQSASVNITSVAAVVKSVPEDPFVRIKNSAVAVVNVVAEKYVNMENATNSV